MHIAQCTSTCITHIQEEDGEEQKQQFKRKAVKEWVGLEMKNEQDNDNRLNQISTDT